MRFIFASLALAQAEECLDETVLLQVKTQHNPMKLPPQASMTGPPMAPTGQMPFSGGIMDASQAQFPMTVSPMAPTGQMPFSGGIMPSQASVSGPPIAPTVQTPFSGGIMPSQASVSGLPMAPTGQMPFSGGFMLSQAPTGMPPTSPGGDHPEHEFGVDHPEYPEDESGVDHQDDGFGGNHPEDEFGGNHPEYPEDEFGGNHTEDEFGGNYPEDELTGHTEDGQGEDMEEIAGFVAEEFNLPIEAVNGFLDQMFPKVFEEFEMGDASFIEEVILDFCQENGGADCHDLAVMGTEHIIEEFHHHHVEDHTEFHLSQCEESSTWPHWHCDEQECYEMGDHIHLNDVHACELSQNCAQDDWQCHDMAWQSTWPVCQHPNMKTVFGDHPSGLPTVAERPDGPPDNVCMLEHHCIQEFGQDHIDNFGWGQIDSCVCDKFPGVEINRDPIDSWHTGYFQDYCHHDDHHHDPATFSDDFNTATPQFFTLMQRISKMAKKGMGKQFLQKSGLARRVNGKKAVKAFLQQALKKKFA